MKIVNFSSIQYNEPEADWPCGHLDNARWAGRVEV